MHDVHHPQQKCTSQSRSNQRPGRRPVKCRSQRLLSSVPRASLPAIPRLPGRILLIPSRDQSRRSTCSSGGSEVVDGGCCLSCLPPSRSSPRTRKCLFPTRSPVHLVPTGSPATRSAAGETSQTSIFLLAEMWKIKSAGVTMRLWKWDRSAKSARWWRSGPFVRCIVRTQVRQVLPHTNGWKLSKMVCVCVCVCGCASVCVCVCVCALVCLLWRKRC